MKLLINSGPYFGKKFLTSIKITNNFLVSKVSAEHTWLSSMVYWYSFKEAQHY